MNFKKIIVPIALLFCLALSLIFPQNYEMKEGIAWFDDYSTALKRAEADSKLLIVTFYTSWCVFCKQMDRDTFTDTRIIELSKRLMPICRKRQRQDTDRKDIRP
jgi:thiol:disulfide interchange protein